jgi:hypothetical protein
MANDRIRSLTPDRTVWANWRGGVVWSIGATTTIRLLAEQHIVRDYVVANSLVPVDARSIGAPVCCRVTGTGADNYVVVEVVGSRFPRGEGPHDQGAAVAAGRFVPAIIERHITREPEAWWSSE